MDKFKFCVCVCLRMCVLFETWSYSVVYADLKLRIRSLNIENRKHWLRFELKCPPPTYHRLLL